MKIEDFRMGMRVRHPNHGLGVVKSINESTIDILFNDEKRTIAPDAAGIEVSEPQVSVQGLQMPLEQFAAKIVKSTLEGLGIEKTDATVEELGPRWHQGRLMLHPFDPALQAKEVPLEVFFHKIVMMRNNLRILEQKINGHEKLSDGEKVDMQQYISRCYGSMTTFNILFKDKQSQFNT
jgi:hypothetical protein